MAYYKPEEKEKSLHKFFYELKLRKREFMNECVKYDFEFSSKLTKVYFEIALDRFTCYPKRAEKEIILNHFLINDTFVNYIDICNMGSNKFTIEDYIYEDAFLQHLNLLKSKNELKNINLNSEKVSRIIDIKPLELLNYQLSEENFLIKIAKKLMDYLLVNSNKSQTNEFFDKLFLQSDFDMDNKFTIGELNLFLNNSGLTLQDYDLRYLFESFKIEQGRLDKDNLFNYICQFSARNYSNPANTDFIKDQKEIFNEEELKDEEKINKILSNNYFFAVVREGLQILGKDFLFKYFARYFEIDDNILLIDSVWLELGFKKLGYKDVPPHDMGNFKFVCVKKLIATLKNEMTINVNIEKLFNFVIAQFNIEEVGTNRDSSKIVEEISNIMLKDVNCKILKYFDKQKDKKKLDVNVDKACNEFEFRRKFIKTFKFIDHNFFDHIIKFLNNNSDSEKQYTGKDLQDDLDKKVFRLEDVKSSNWSQLGLNLLFMSMIRSCDQLGLMLEISEIVQLKNIYNNLENKIFPKNTISQKVLKSIKQGDKQFVVTEDKSEKFSILNIIKKKKEKEEEESKGVSYLNKKDSSTNNNEKTNMINLLKYKTENTTVSIKENVTNQPSYRKTPPVSLDNPYNNNTNNNYKSGINVNDTANIIPELFTLCSDYLKKKFNIEEVNTAILSNFGCCKIFRDHLTANKVDIRNEVNLSLLVSYLRTVPSMTDTIWKFLEFFASSFTSKDRNNNSNVNVQYLFMKIEEVLIQYSKIKK